MHRVRIRIGNSGKEMLWGVDVPHVKKYVTTGNKNETKKAQKKMTKKMTNNNIKKKLIIINIIITTHFFTTGSIRPALCVLCSNS